MGHTPPSSLIQAADSPLAASAPLPPLLKFFDTPSTPPRELEYVGQPEDAELLAEHKPQDEVLGRVYEEAAEVLRKLPRTREGD